MWIKSSGVLWGCVFRYGIPGHDSQWRVYWLSLSDSCFCFFFFFFCFVCLLILILVIFIRIFFIIFFFSTQLRFFSFIFQTRSEDDFVVYMGVHCTWWSSIVFPFHTRRVVVLLLLGFYFCDLFGFLFLASLYE